MLGPFCGSYIVRFPLVSNPVKHEILSVSSQSFKGKKGTLPGVEALFGLHARGNRAS